MAGFPAYSIVETGIICVTVRRIIERKRVSHGAVVTNHSAEGTVEGGATFTDGGGKKAELESRGEMRREGRDACKCAAIGLEGTVRVRYWVFF